MQNIAFCIDVSGAFKALIVSEHSVFFMMFGNIVAVVVVGLCVFTTAYGQKPNVPQIIPDVCNFFLVPGYIVGQKAYTKFGQIASVADCCDHCTSDVAHCVAFTFEASSKLCFLKNSTYSNTTSGREGTVLYSSFEFVSVAGSC